MKKKRRREDPFAEIKEWQDHRYDPGYFTGGRIHPMYQSRRSNRWGYVLIGSGGFALLLLGANIRRGGPVLETIWATAFTILLIAAGIRLAKGAKRP
jgi:hypothetical protein